jgi:cytoskeletal protein CcmA (bactofilin family)
MFKSKSKSKNETAKTVTSSSTIPTTSNVIASGTIIEGTITASKDVRLDGTLLGEAHFKQKLVMGETGRVEGTVNCGESNIKGKIDGEINVNGLLHLLNTAFIKGRIRAKKMVVDEGASYSGECLIGEHHFGKQPVSQ